MERWCGGRFRGLLLGTALQILTYKRPTHAWNSSTVERGGDRRIAAGPSWLAGNVSPRFRERSCLERTGRG